MTGNQRNNEISAKRHPDLLADGIRLDFGCVDASECLQGGETRTYSCLRIVPPEKKLREETMLVHQFEVDSLEAPHFLLRAVQLGRILLFDGVRRAARYVSPPPGMTIHATRFTPIVSAPAWITITVQNIDDESHFFSAHFLATRTVDAAILKRGP